MQKQTLYCLQKILKQIKTYLYQISTLKTINLQIVQYLIQANPILKSFVSTNVSLIWLQIQIIMADIFQNSNQTVKMLDFMKHLYKRYKVLNQLTEAQSRNFQCHIVSLLVDQEENVDLQVLENVARKESFEAFLIGVLGDVLERPSGKSVLPAPKNLDSNYQSLKKEQNQLQKKGKILERKQQRLKANEQELLSACKQKLAILQSEAVKRISGKENELKKSINNLLNQLKSKQKVLLQKLEIVKSNKATLKLIQQKERYLNEKVKVVQKREKELKSRDDSQLILKKDSQIQEYIENNNKLKESLKELTAKYKNMELAYRKIKGDNQKLTAQRQTRNKEKSIQKNDQRQRKNLELDNLQISLITHEITAKSFTKEVIQKLASIPNLLSNQNEKTQVRAILSKICSNQNIFPQNSQNSKQSSEQDLSFLKLEQFAVNPHQNLIQQILSFHTQNSKGVDSFFKNSALQKLMEKTAQLRYPLEVCTKLLQFMLEMLQKSDNDQKIVNCYSSSNVVSHLQKVYLCHQTNEQIAESTTLVLSRIKLWKNEITLFDNFRKAIEIRKLLQSGNSLLFINIKYLL